MTSLRTGSEIDEYVAREIESFRPDLAALLRSKKKPGPKSTRDEHGLSPHDYRRADLHLEMKGRIESGEDRYTVLADTAKAKGISIDRLESLLELDGESRVRRALKVRGPGYPGP